MTNCLYCGGEIPSKDFALRTPGGNYFCFPCGDKALDEWVRVKEENVQLREKMQKINDIAVNYQEDGPFIDTVTFAIISEIYDLSSGEE